MNITEIAALTNIVAVHRPRLLEGDADTTRTAWYMALDTRLPLHVGIAIVANLAAEGVYITPAAINERWLASIRKPHVQGTPRPRLPVGDPVRGIEEHRAPLEIGSPAPVKPQDVPEYVAARNGEVYGSNPAWLVQCPHCGAEPHQPCVTRRDGVAHRLRHRSSHPAREAAAGVRDQFSGMREHVG